MKYLGFSVKNGLENMQTDENLLKDCIEKQEQEGFFRLYGWKPKCISLGRNQRKIAFDDIDVVRRLTGGRALLHDDEITYCCVIPSSIVPNGESVIASYKYISGILIEFFKTLNVVLDYGDTKKHSSNVDYCMLLATGADVCYEGKKVIGSAQCRKNGYILQHGSILFDYDKKLLESLFHEEVKGITCMREILPNLTKEDFIRRFEDFIKNF